MPSLVLLGILWMWLSCGQRDWKYWNGWRVEEGICGRLQKIVCEITTRRNVGNLMINSSGMGLLKTEKFGVVSAGIGIAMLFVWEVGGKEVACVLGMGEVCFGWARRGYLIVWSGVVGGNIYPWKITQLYSRNEISVYDGSIFTPLLFISVR